jgi:hypothetical protein
VAQGWGGTDPDWGTTSTGRECQWPMHVAEAAGAARGVWLSLTGRGAGVTHASQSEGCRREDTGSKLGRPSGAACRPPVTAQLQKRDRASTAAAPARAVSHPGDQAPLGTQIGRGKVATRHVRQAECLSVDLGGLWVAGIALCVVAAAVVVLFAV